MRHEVECDMKIASFKWVLWLVERGASCACHASQERTDIDVYGNKNNFNCWRTELLRFSKEMKFILGALYRFICFFFSFFFGRKGDLHFHTHSCFFKKKIKVDLKESIYLMQSFFLQLYLLQSYTSLSNISTLQGNSLAVVYLGYFYLIFSIRSFFFFFCIGIFQGGLERVKLCKNKFNIFLSLHICFNCNSIQKPL